MRAISNLEEIFSLQWILQKTLHKGNESGLCRFQLCISKLPQTKKVVQGLFFNNFCCLPLMHLHLRWQYLVVVFPSSSGSLENSENPDLSLCIAPESTENKYINRKVQLQDN